MVLQARISLLIFLISFSQAIIHIYVCYLHPVYRLGDGVTDDTAAINAAISAGGRYGHGCGQSSTTAPAIIYFPAERTSSRDQSPTITSPSSLVELIAGY
jgi:pectate lyase-like protein